MYLIFENLKSAIFRLCRALALAPFVDRGLSWFTTKMKFKSQGKVSEIVSFSGIINVTRFLQFTVWFCNPGFRGRCRVLLWFGFYAVSHSYITLGMKILCCSFVQVGIYRVLLLKAMLVQVTQLSNHHVFSFVILSFHYYYAWETLMGWSLLYFIFSHRVITSYAKFGAWPSRIWRKILHIPFRHVFTLGVLKILVIHFLEFLAYGIVL